MKKIILLIIVAGILIVASSIITYAQTIVLNLAGHRIILRIRSKVMSHIQSLSHEQFNEIPVGKLVTRVTSDVNVLWDMYTHIILNLIKNIVKYN